jgi:hypothetical protein
MEVVNSNGASVGYDVEAAGAEVRPVRFEWATGVYD